MCPALGAPAGGDTAEAGIGLARAHSRGGKSRADGEGGRGGGEDQRAHTSDSEPHTAGTNTHTVISSLKMESMETCPNRSKWKSVSLSILQPFQFSNEHTY